MVGLLGLPEGGLLVASFLLGREGSLDFLERLSGQVDGQREDDGVSYPLEWVATCDDGSGDVDQAEVNQMGEPVGRLKLEATDLCGGGDGSVESVEGHL